MSAYDYVAFGAMAVVFFGVVYLVIWLGDLPASVATEKGHPQVASVRALAWMGLLFTGGVLWIVAFAWAFYDYASSNARPTGRMNELADLERRIEALESRSGKAGEPS